MKHIEGAVVDRIVADGQLRDLWTSIDQVLNGRERKTKAASDKIKQLRGIYDRNENTLASCIAEIEQITAQSEPLEISLSQVLEDSEPTLTELRRIEADLNSLSQQVRKLETERTLICDKRAMQQDSFFNCFGLETHADTDEIDVVVHMPPDPSNSYKIVCRKDRHRKGLYLQLDQIELKGKGFADLEKSYTRKEISFAELVARSRDLASRNVYGALDF